MAAKVWLALSAMLVIFAALLFGSAGTVRWFAGWAYLIIFFGGSLGITVMLARHDPDLLAERMKMRAQKGQPLWDKVFMVLLQVIWCVWFALMGLDSVRFGWSVMPPWLSWIAGTGLILSFWIMYRVFQENTFLAPVVKIQRDRGQRVIDTGPYAVVRHPLYAATLLFLPGTALMLGSWYGLAASPVLVGGLVFRTVMEERELRRGLEGYQAYTQRVRYRLVPFVW
jgi:protein-S-isoprenylcysteine O-methyltransferase Ste14